MCVYVVEEVIELLVMYGRCESYWGKCDSC